MTTDQLIIFLAGIVGGALRVGVPFLFVSLGECLTEKSGRINLGLEGVLVLSAMVAFGGSYLSGSPWVGVLAAAVAGALLATLHGLLCSLPRVNDIATGIALMLLGMGLAFYLGKPLIQPQAPQLPAIPLGFWSDSAAVRSALQINALLPIGLVLAVAIAVVGRLADRHPTHQLVSIGLVLLSASFGLMVTIDPGRPMWVIPLLVTWAIVGRIGLGFILPSLNIGAMRGLERVDIAQGASVINFLRMLGGAAGVSLCGIVLEWRLAAHGVQLTAGGVGTPARVAAFEETFLMLAAICALALTAALKLRAAAPPPPQ
ncbi:hypothetical protein [Hydrogenophaga sp.]|jgi:hypothetical protein|uniref:ABC transporter permease subunit n=1 Tax=Hydrogenophaga sp. TaxID=1904254 RepID=UPI0025BE280E|nr:hypothetical protein [Hydrogenophaga sp.]